MLFSMQFLFVSLTSVQGALVSMIY